MSRFLVLLIIALFVIQTTSSAQIEKINLAGKHTIFVGGGFKTNSTTSVSISSPGIEVKAGFIGNINYGYWFNEEWSLIFSAGVFGGGTSVRFNGIETKSITPLLFGVRFYPEKFSLGSVGRIYAGIALGQYMGSGTRLKFFSTETFSESVFGGEVSAGVDLFVVSWFKFGPKLSYFFLNDFKEITGTVKNFSGVAVSFDFGFVL